MLLTEMLGCHWLSNEEEGETTTTCITCTTSCMLYSWEISLNKFGGWFPKRYRKNPCWRVLIWWFGRGLAEILVDFNLAVVQTNRQS